VPKELFEIKAFESGNIYNADDRDIPDDAAVYSENIDPYAQSGSLMAIQADATAIKSGVDAKRMAMINNNGTHQLAYIDNSDGYLKQISDVYTGSPAITNLVESNLGSDTIPAMQTNNKEVHIGLGQNQNVKWVGNIPHGQFGGSAPSGLQAEDAELIAPSPFPLMHTIVNDATNTYAYGISQNGTYVYKFNVSTGRLIKRSDYYFTKTRAMCLASDGHLWVLDEISTNIKIIKIDPTDMDSMIITSVNAFTNDQSVTDCIDIDDHLWLSCNIETDNSVSGFLYNTLKSGIVSGATISFTDRTPYLGASGGTVSEGSWTNTSGTSILPTFNIPKLALSEPANSQHYCGIMMHVTTDGSTTNSVKFCKANTGTPAYGTTTTWYYQMIHKDNTADHVDHKANGGEGGKVRPLISTTTVPSEMYCAKGSDNSTNLFLSQKGSGSTSTLSTVTKPQFSQTNGTNITKSSIAASRDLEGMVGDATANNYNLFSSSGAVRWATSNGSTVIAKKEGEVDLSFTVNSNVAGTINGGHSHFYATSFIYDGYQESPLAPWQLETGISGSNVSINVKIDLYTATLNKRISHINLYRSSPGNTSTQPTGFFRLIKTVSLKYGWLHTDTNTSNPNWGNYYTKTVLDTGVSYSSYESRTGISEALLNTIPKYGLSAKVNNFLYITDCSHIDIDDATNYLFKSRPFNFDQFNWAKDFLLLPNKATAIESFNGRLYVFSENETYVVNPDGMYIEDTIKGIGCRNQNGVVSSEIGMCFIDKNSIYLHNGQGINDIGAKIKKAHQVDDTYNSYSTLEKLCNYSANDYTGDIVIAYDSYRKAFCFMYTYKYLTSSSFTHSCNLNNNDTTITCDVANSNIAPNQVVTGNHIPADTKVASVDNDNRFDINNNATATAVSTLTFTTNTTYYVPQCLVYTVPKNRWDVWNRTNSSTTTDFNTYGAVHGKNNELFVSDTDNGLIQPFDPTNSTRLDNFKWYSKKFTMGESTTDKKIYKAEILSEDNSPTITLNTIENSSSYAALSDKKIARHAQVKIAVTGDSTATVDALRLVFRRLRRTKDMS